MEISYKKLWIKLAELGISKPELRRNADISQSTFTKLNKNQVVALVVLIRICEVLDCDIGEIMEVLKSERR